MQSWENRVAALVFLTSLLVYLLTMYPSVAFGDGADMVLAAISWGIPHPTGYPLYTLVAYLVSFLPVGDAAYRINLLSGFFGAATSMVLYLVLIEIQRKKDGVDAPAIVASAAGAAVFAFSRMFWSQAIQAEIYTFQMLILAVLFLLLVRWWHEPEDKYLVWMAIGFGLGTSHHISMALFAPAFLAGIASHRPETLRRPTFLLKLAGLFVLGLTPFLLMPLRSYFHPLRNWGDTHVLANFLGHIRGSSYSQHFYFFPSGGTLKQMLVFWRTLLKQFGWPLLALSLPGLVWVYLRDRNLLSFLFVAVGANLLYALNIYQIGELTFYLPTFFIAALLIGLGLSLALTVVAEARPRAAAVACVAVLAVAAVPLGLNLPSQNHRGDWTAYDYSEGILGELGPDAILLFDGDNSFPIEYLHYGLRMRPDVSVLQMSALDRQWYLDEIRRLHPNLKIPATASTVSSAAVAITRDNSPGHPVYLNQFTKLSGYGLTYEGSLFKVAKGGGVRFAEAKKFSYRTPTADAVDPDYFQQLAVAAPQFNRLQAQYATGDTTGVLQTADEIRRLYPESALGVFQQGLALELAKKNDQALEKYLQALQADPLFGDVYYAAAKMYLQFDPHYALGYLETARIFEPNRPEIHYSLATLYEHNGNIGASQWCWRRILSLEAPEGMKAIARKELKKLARR